MKRQEIKQKKKMEKYLLIFHNCDIKLNNSNDFVYFKEIKGMIELNNSPMI